MSYELRVKCQLHDFTHQLGIDIPVNRDFESLRVHNVGGEFGGRFGKDFSVGRVVEKIFSTMSRFTQWTRC